MKAKSTNATVAFEPEAVSENVSIFFVKATKPSGITVTGRIKKGEAEVGSIVLTESDNYLLTSLKPFNSLTKEEVEAIYTKVPGFLAEILNV